MPSAKLKIGFVYDDSLDGLDGVAQYVKTLGRWLSDEGHQVRYLVGETKMTSWAGGKVYSLAKNARVDFNRNRLSIPLPASRRRIKEILANEKFDVLHVQVPHSPFLAHKVIKSADSRTVVVGTFHVLPAGKLARAGSKGLRTAYGRGLSRFDRMLSVSQPAADFARTIFGLDSEVLPNVVDMKKFETKTQTNEKLVVFLGRLVPRKGAMQLLQAFKILHMTNPGFRLIIAGDGPERPKLEKYVAKTNLTRSVKFRGKIPESAKPELLASAAVACFPATGGESFGIVLIEAMAAGSGVVLGGNNLGYRSVLGAQPDLLINPDDSVKFAQRLKRLLTNQEMASRLHAWQSAEVKKYDVTNIGKSLTEIYRQAIAKRRREVA